MTSTAETTQPTVKPVAEGGGYIVLLATEDGWAVVAQNRTARSAEHAIRQWAEKATTLNGATVVAIPARSWKPVKVSARTETRLIVEDAT